MESSIATPTPPAVKGSHAMSRRKWLSRVASTVVLGSVGLGAYTWRFEPHWVEVIHRDLPIENLPAELEGRSLVQLSDIHIGDRVDDDFLINAFQRVSSWQPDFVVFTGDFLTLRRDRSLPIEKMKHVLAHFPQGTRGTIGILGNHDYGIAWSSLKAAKTVVEIAQNAGIQMLRNQSTSVEGLQIVGFDDYYSPNFGGRTVLRNVEMNQPTLVLCHNPDVVDLPIWHGYRGWILSGHTHGGQCKPPFLPPPLVPIDNRRYTAGHIPLEDGRQLYVNRALGYSIRVRFNVRPEITVFRLVRSELDHFDPQVALSKMVSDPRDRVRDIVRRKLMPCVDENEFFLG